MLWKHLRAKLRSAFRKSKKCRSRSSSRGKYRATSGSISKLTMNEEYAQAFRTDSYIKLWVRGHARQLPSSTTTSRSSSSNSLHSSSSSEYLLEPRQETLNDIIHDYEGLNDNVDHFVTDYLEVSLDAYHIYDLLLRNIYKTRVEYRKIKKLTLTKLSRRLLVLSFLPIINRQILPQDQTNNNDNCASASPEDDEQWLATLAPLSIVSPLPFGDVHDGCMSLFHRLNLKHKKMKRYKIAKKIGGAALVVPHSALLIASLLVFAIHGMIGLWACSNMGLCARKMEAAHEWLKARFPDQSPQQLDVAARGVYVLVYDFDSMKQMVSRLQNEVQQLKFAASTCVKSVRSSNSCGSSSSCDIFKEAVRVFQATESDFLEQLKELEERIYLCVLNINRSRRLLVQEIMNGRHSGNHLVMIVDKWSERLRKKMHI